MAMVNVSKPSSSMSNIAKAVGGQIWDTNTTTWNTETRTWNDMISFIDNTTKVSSSITNISKPI